MSRMWTGRDDEDEPRRPPEPPDTLSVGVGAAWFVARHTVPECKDARPRSTTTGYPQRFDRFYPHADGGRLLVDVLACDRADRAVQMDRKNVPFKREWCAANGWRYLAIDEYDTTDEQRVRQLVAGLGQHETTTTTRPRRARRTVSTP